VPAFTRTAASAVASQAPLASAPAAGNAVLLNVLKEELFAIESERISGTISEKDYADIKTGLEAVLKRALFRK
jgi:hypothetical protein